MTQSVGEQNEKELSTLFGIEPEKFTVSENLLDLEKPIVWSTLEEPVHVFDGYWPDSLRQHGTPVT